MYATPDSDRGGDEALESKKVPASILNLPKATLNEMTEKYLVARGLNLTGLGETYSTSDDSSECEDILKCTHCVKKVAYVPKVNWREKVQQYKELVKERQDKSAGTLPEVKRTHSEFMMKKEPDSQIFSLQNYHRILRDQQETKSADKLQVIAKNAQQTGEDFFYKYKRMSISSKNIYKLGKDSE